jgi:hypothetical protein
MAEQPIQRVHNLRKAALLDRAFSVLWRAMPTYLEPLTFHGNQGKAQPDLQSCCVTK